MKKIISFILFIVSIILSNAQDFQGKAFYKSKMTMTIKMDSTEVSNDQQQMINAMLMKQMQKDYELSFDRKHSLYKEVEGLGDVQEGGIQVIMAGKASVLYRNTQEKRFVNQNEFMGKEFLIKDVIEKPIWKLENESKKIGNYTCYKATTIEKKEVHNQETDSITIEKNSIIAWYAPQIPVTHGPSTYWGLPGLILEVNTGGEIMICDKIIVNPKEKVHIKEPSKGKEVDQKNYDKIVKDKLEEMEEMYEDNRKKGDTNTIEIKIGG